MKAVLLLLLSLLPLCFSLAQQPAYKEKFKVGSTPAMSIHSMAIDRENALYLTEYSRVVKVKDGKIVLDFSINESDYIDPNTSYNGQRVYIDLAVDQDQFIYILNRTKKRIEKHDQQGNLLKLFPAVGDVTTGQSYSMTLHIDHADNLNIFDTYNRRIYVFNTDGTLVETINLADPDPKWESGHATIAFDQQNNIYIAETKKYTWNPTAYITHLNREGKIIQRFSEAVMKESGFNTKFFLTLKVDNNGDVYAYQTGNVNSNPLYSPLTIFSPTGLLKKRLSVNTAPGSSILFDNQNNMYVNMASPSGDYILKYDREQQLMERIGNRRRPYEVAFDHADNLYILDHITRNVVKYNAAGEENKDFRLNVSNIINPLTFTIDDKGFIYVLEYGGLSNSPSSRIKKFEPNGNLVTNLPAYIPGSYEGYQGYVSAGLAVDKKGNIYVTTYNNSDTHSLLKFNPQGEQIAKIGPKGREPGQLDMPVDVTVDDAGNLFILDLNGRRIQKFSSSGTFMQQYGSFDPKEGSIALRSSIASDAFGNVVVASPAGSHASPDVKYYDLTGKLRISLPFNIPSLTMNRSGSLIAMTDPNFDVVTIYEATSTREYNIIAGNIYQDENANCVLDANEAGLADMLVKAEPGPYYGATDANGDYRLTVGKGSFKVGPLSEKQLGKLVTLTCKPGNTADSIHFENFGYYAADNNFGAKVILSPFLNVSVSSTRRRRCLESETTVQYANNGFAPAEHAKVYLQLPAQVELLSANKPYTRLPNGTYVFEVGTLAAGARGTITIKDKVICGDESVRGLTVCTKAWITPPNTSPAGKAITSVTGTCIYATGHVRFVIRNSGQVDMSSQKEYRVYKDAQLAIRENYSLAAGDSLVLLIPAEGKTWRLEADQPKGNSAKLMANATVEACSIIYTRIAVSSGFVNVFATDDEEAEIAEECLPIIDSYDPNDKLVTPAGLTEENYTPTGAALKYKIRFQNTGTDVAYRVVVVDTLSGHLDLSTLQVGSASHPYTMDVSGKGRPVLTWTFDNIMLPDSTSNEPGSHGFIQFSIHPKADLAEKTAVENFADIFFDFNSPVRTNVTVNRIYDMPPVIEEKNKINLEEVNMTTSIAGFTPAAGKFGTEFTIMGAKFSAGATTNKVYINGMLAEVLEGDATSLKVRVPVGASTGNIRVITAHSGATSAAAFEVYQPPVINSFSPAEGIIGSEVTLQGDYLTPELVEQIQLGSVACEVISFGINAVTLKVPAQAASNSFTIHTKGGAVQSSAPFRVWHTPVLTGFDRTRQRIGGRLTLQGENFAPEPGRNIVSFGSLQAEVLRATEHSLEVSVPAGAQTGTVSITTPGGTASRAFEVIPAPILSVVQPASGSVGTVVELKGEHFMSLGQSDTVTFNGVEAMILETSGSSIKVRVPRGAVSGKVTVAGSGGRDAADFIVEPLTAQQSIDVYPNPSDERFTVDFLRADFDVYAVQVFDTTGNIVHSEKLNAAQAGQLEVDFTDKKAGLYLVVVQTARGTIVKKLSLL